MVLQKNDVLIVIMYSVLKCHMTCNLVKKTCMDMFKYFFKIEKELGRKE
jgi:hypothetical protein